MYYVKLLIDLVVAIPVVLLMLLVKIAGIERSSRAFSTLMIWVGPRLKHNRTVINNLRICYPKLSEAELLALRDEVWSNMGAIIGESIHWCTMSLREFNERVKIHGFQERYRHEALIFVSAHLSNFEVYYKLCEVVGMKSQVIGRKINNRFLDIIIQSLRENSMISVVPKGAAALKHIIATLQANNAVGILVDQKLREGVDATFFGHSAKTSNLPAKLAIKMGVRVLMVRVERIGVARYEVFFSEPFKKTDFNDADSLTQKINDNIEQWVRKSPGEWFWMHNRWTKFS